MRFASPGRRFWFRSGCGRIFSAGVGARYFCRGKQNDVPLLAGWNHDEGSYEIAFAPQKPTVETLKATAQKEFGDKATDF